MPTPSLSSKFLESFNGRIEAMKSSIPTAFDSQLMDFLHFCNESRALLAPMAELRSYEPDRVRQEAHQALFHNSFPHPANSTHSAAFRLHLIELLLRDARRQRRPIVLLPEVLTWLAGVGALERRNPPIHVVAYSMSNMMQVHIAPLMTWLVKRVAAMEVDDAMSQAESALGSLRQSIAVVPSGPGGSCVVTGSVKTFVSGLKGT